MLYPIPNTINKENESRDPMISNVSLDSIVNKQRGTHYFTQNSTLLQERLQTANYTEKKKKVHCQAVPTTNTQMYCTLSLSSRPKCVPGVNKIFMKILLPTVFRNVTLLTSVWTLPSRLPQLIFTEFLRALSSKEPE